MDTPILRPIRHNRIIWNNNKYLFFGGYDYHRLSTHPKVIRAAKKALNRYGMNCGGSRITTGNHPLHVKLEQEICQFLGTDSCVLLPTGFMTNLALLESLKDSGYICYCDEKMHPSLKMAVSSSGLSFHYFTHQDINDLKNKLNDKYRPIIITDGISSTVPPLKEYLNLVEEYDGLLIVDEAHCIGVQGKTGRGACEAENCSSSRIILTGSLSKAPGTGGGFAAGSKMLIQEIRKTITYGTTSAPSLPVTAASIASIHILRTCPKMVKRLQKESLELKTALKDHGYDIEISDSPVIAIRVGSADKTDALYAILKKNKIYPPFISYPGKTPYFRFTLSSSHTEKQLEKLRRTLCSFIIET